MAKWNWRLAGLVLLAALVPACGRGGGGATLFTGVSNQTLRLNGGNGVTKGGKGGALNVLASTGGDLKVRRSWQIEKNFTLPPATPDLGPNPRTISGSIILTADTTTFDLPGDLPGPPATGLHVLPGATLTLKPNAGGATPTDPQTGILIHFTHGVLIEGTVRAAHEDSTGLGDGAGNHTASLQFVLQESLSIASKASLDTSGTDQPSGPGGNGGAIAISARHVIFNQGTVEASGGNGSTGGNGGQIDLNSDSNGIFNTGVINSTGGDGTGSGGPVLTAAVDSIGNAFAGNTTYMLESSTQAWMIVGQQVVVSGATDSNNNGTFTVVFKGSVDLTLANAGGVMESNSPAIISPVGGGSSIGGNAGAISLLALNIGSQNLGGIFNSGPLTARGGPGTDGGGKGALIDLGVRNAGVGAVVSSAMLDSSGGEAVTAGDGGTAGDIKLESRSGTLRVLGLLQARGGLSRGGGWSGGAGGKVTIRMTGTPVGGAIQVEGSTGAMSFGASVDTTGGDGDFGGLGGALDITAEGGDQVAPFSDIVLLAGYDLIDTSGGHGDVDGGDAGLIHLQNSNHGGFQGGILNETPLSAVGGWGDTGNGGIGGAITIENTANGIANIGQSTANGAPLTSHGGICNASGTGGKGGDIFLYDPYQLKNSGDIDSRGGFSFGTGGNAGSIQLISDGNTSNDANLTASANDGDRATEIAGGSASEILILGRRTTTSGNLTARGGDATATGGNGALIMIFSTDTTSQIHGTLLARAGLNLGAPGEIRIDGILIPTTSAGTKF